MSNLLHTRLVTIYKLMDECKHLRLVSSQRPRRLIEQDSSISGPNNYGYQYFEAFSTNQGELSSARVVVSIKHP